MDQAEQINYWANMLNEAMCDKAQIDEIDLSTREGSMAQVIKDKIIQTDLLNGCKTKQEVHDLVSRTFAENGIDTPASRRLLFNIGRSRDLTSAMYTVINSYGQGAGIGVNGPRRRFGRDMYEEEEIDERRMTGPAAAAKGGKDEIAEFRQMLDDGIVEFEFRKADGSLRHAIGTTSEAVVPTSERKALDPDYDANLVSYKQRAAYIIWFWDLEKNACRCFNTNRFEGVVKAEKTAKHVDNNVTQVGNIFIHKDVDADMEDPNKITLEKAEDINSKIDADFHVQGTGPSGYFSFADMPALTDIELDIGPSGEPILKIVIRKHGSDSDQPYQLRLNDLRKAILDKYGVNVKKVVVDGEFQF